MLLRAEDVPELLEEKLDDVREMIEGELSQSDLKNSEQPLIVDEIMEIIKEKVDSLEDIQAKIKSAHMPEPLDLVLFF